MMKRTIGVPAACLFAVSLGLVAAMFHEPVFAVGAALIILALLVFAVRKEKVNKAIGLLAGCGFLATLLGLFLGRDCFSAESIARNLLSFPCNALFGGGVMLAAVAVFLGAKSKRGAKTLCLLAQLPILLGVLLLWYVSDSSSAVPEQVKASLMSNETVTVVREKDSVFFDAEGDENVLVFYPGAKVDYLAYAPLMRAIAGEGTDVYLLRMPYNLAFFDMNAADRVLGGRAYTNVVVGGHSLGGVAAAQYAAENAERVQGVFLAASYPNKPLPEGMTVLSVYGTQDGVLNFEKMKNAQKNMPTSCTEIGIEGGNHAQFGCYGAQKGDNAADISADVQQSLTAEAYAEVFLSR